MKHLLLSLTVLLSGAAAQAQDLFCKISVNNEVMVDTKVSTVVGKNAAIGTYDNYQISVRNQSAGKFYIEVYETNVSRSYADGVLRTEEDEMKWTLWSREILMEASCRLAI
ncbi:hypothetical protein [Bdellovibrio bacteriovorus]|uniref:Uncharacterized protein n=2 Tax=Bdellovibrio bacteriovorus TaxID=959 RepID=Q6MPZ2_BDEBA|nr:hypothetical protein [Bdellovibrio bacteriovorus]AHZ86764.1 hypothetical protein EP01_17750 [Bdellovibrio bacteriovorus]ASD64772.1 hypothetical protein B9G79_14970 [Bdellovibrio bacteriovorus]BEV67204.1 hypothetical protein Bb109J_c0624 [Bdellovibrio bacteriovorus]CAE78655.1 hypothetical protein predicted by Glimmer/Critica [Bdellovibrio bacteriovorus HD100]